MPAWLVTLVHLRTQRTTVSARSGKWKQPQNQSLKSHRFRAYILYHPISHVSLLFSLLPHCSLVFLFRSLSQYDALLYAIDSCTSLPNERVTHLVRNSLHHFPLRHLPTISNHHCKCDGHYTFAYSTLSPCLILYSHGRRDSFFSHIS